MIRTVITADKQTISFDVPENYLGKQIEVIAFAKDEGDYGFYKERADQRKVSFTVFHVDARNYKFNRDEANER